MNRFVFAFPYSVEGPGRERGARSAAFKRGRVRDRYSELSRAHCLSFHFVTSCFSSTRGCTDRMTLCCKGACVKEREARGRHEVHTDEIGG